MKLGSETGSLVNSLQARGTRGQPAPEIGMAITAFCWTDRYPGTIREIFQKGRWLFIRCTGDEYRRTDSNGFSESQSYEYTTTEDHGGGFFFKRLAADPDAQWIGVRKNSETGRFSKNGHRVRIGSRERLRPSF